MSRLFLPFVLLQYLLPQHALSRFVALFAEGSFLKNALIKTFIRRYRVDLSEALISDPAEFASFNAFFTRELKPGARPIEDAGDSFVCPADGTISQLGNISNDQLLQAKGRHYSVVDLLGGDTELAAQFLDGSFATVYLSPRDYHRVHMPLAGRLDRMVYIPGKLFSVNARTTAAVPNLFARNERVACLFQSDAGPMALILVGAMIVAGIETVWSGQVCPGLKSRTVRESSYTDHSPPIELPTGAEMGRFKLGSTVIALFGPGAVDLDSTLMPEAAVRMGQAMGTVVGTL
ncbi:MAG: archaetidylserine decarboxylase [Gammaproteobacteria bacterium]|jgi:phosphatidylserine decarboxylase|nr:archaetidylserine decarboxylase [Gammaproteobacteria bacterium]MDP6731612.1 archaetidylserine decarboxylase [Gammaproteobacteria bacterium]